MILTGKAKEDFEKWYLDKKIHFDVLTILDSGKLNQLNKLYKSCINALIIEWFDSVGVYISILTQENDRKERRFTSDINEQNFISCETRQQATEEAIKKACEIYNKN